MGTPCYIIMQFFRKVRVRGECRAMRTAIALSRENGGQKVRAYTVLNELLGIWYDGKRER
jgi:hypothetical protein